MIERGQYTGIIKTMPADWCWECKMTDDEFQKRIDAMNRFDFHWWFSLSGRPRYDVLHFYLLMRGRIWFRANIVSLEGPQSLDCEDGTTRFGRCWAMLGPPIVHPPREIRMKGFQGFRYTGDLW